MRPFRRGNRANSEPALKADLIITRHVIAGMAAGVIPLPILFDIAAVSAIEVNMIARLAKAYSVPVPQRHVVAKVLVSLAGGIAPAYLSAKSTQLITGFPLAGRFIFVAGLSLWSGVSVYAVGKVFQEHFESGGTFLSRDSSVIRAFFDEKKAEARIRVPALIRAEPKVA